MKFLKSSWKYVLLIMMGLYLMEIITGLIMTLGKYKLYFMNHIATNLQQNLCHPIYYEQLYVSQQNPFLIITSLMVIIYTGYFLLKHNSKNKSWKTADTDTHGSAQWGNRNKLLANHYFSMSQQKLAENFNNTINKEQLDKLIKQQRKEMVDQ